MSAISLLSGFFIFICPLFIYISWLLSPVDTISTSPLCPAGAFGEVPPGFTSSAPVSEAPYIGSNSIPTEFLPFILSLNIEGKVLLGNCTTLLGVPSYPTLVSFWSNTSTPPSKDGFPLL